MGLEILGSVNWWGLCLVGTTLLKVIEGGKKRRVKGAHCQVDVGSMLEAMPEAVFLIDDLGRVTSVNRNAEKLIGRERLSLIGQDAPRILSEFLESTETLPSILAPAWKGESHRSVPSIFRSPDGDALKVVLTASPVRDQSNCVCAALLTVQDVTELAALQKQSDSNERQVAVGQMTAGMVHDFNNVLSTIAEAVTVLQTSEQRSQRDSTVLGIIRNAVHYGTETIRHTREYLIGSREKPAMLDIRELLEEVLELTHPALKTHSNITVVRETHDCGAVFAIADELRRAFTNLVLNALEAMPRGGTLTVGCAREEGRVMVKVHDTGTGIPADVQKKIFKPYFTTKTKGTGLGLAGARRAIQAQGGDIRFESSPSVGTIFFVSLPPANNPAQLAPSAA
jgi:two-component system, NtrC family, sensor histidine kinase AtoS